MGLPSLKDMLRNGRPGTTDYVRCLQVVLAGISRHTVDGRDDELAAFRETLLQLSGEIREQSSASEIDKIIDDALEHLREYNQRAATNNQGYIGEMRAALRTMTETITFLSESRTRSVHQLQFIEREMEQAVQLEDIRLLRSKLTSCLNAVRQETMRLQTESQTRSQEVVAQIVHPAKPLELPKREPATRFGSMDSVTGLPARKTAEECIVEALSGNKSVALALFVVNRLPGINARYGREIGDEVMLRVSNHFAQHLSVSTSLFRWSGPALVALAQVTGNFEEMERAWTKTAAMKHELNLETGGRAVFVMVETSINFFALKTDMPPHEIFRTLDQSVAGYTDSDAAAN